MIFQFFKTDLVIFVKNLCPGRINVKNVDFIVRKVIWQGTLIFCKDVIGITACDDLVWIWRRVIVKRLQIMQRS